MEEQCTTDSFGRELCPLDKMECGHDTIYNDGYSIAHPTSKTTESFCDPDETREVIAGKTYCVKAAEYTPGVCEEGTYDKEQDECTWYGDSFPEVSYYTYGDVRWCNKWGRIIDTGKFDENKCTWEETADVLNSVNYKTSNAKIAVGCALPTEDMPCCFSSDGHKWGGVSDPTDKCPLPEFNVLMTAPPSTPASYTCSDDRYALDEESKECYRSPSCVEGAVLQPDDTCLDAYIYYTYECAPGAFGAGTPNDAGGDCGSSTCTNDLTPPKDNCEYDNFTCPIDNSLQCVNEQGEIARYAKSLLFSFEEGDYYKRDEFGVLRGFYCTSDVEMCRFGMNAIEVIGGLGICFTDMQGFRDCIGIQSDSECKLSGSIGDRVHPLEYVTVGADGHSLVGSWTFNVLDENSTLSSDDPYWVKEEAKRVYSYAENDSLSTIVSAMDVDLDTLAQESGDTSEISEVRISAEINVDTGYDNDLVGLVFGQKKSDGSFYSISWGQGDAWCDSQGTPRGLALTQHDGMAASWCQVTQPDGATGYPPPSYGNEVTFCRRYADRNGRDSAGWVCVGGGEELLTDFVGDVDSNDDLDYRVSVNGLDDSMIHFCRRYADRNGREEAVWECVNGGEPLLTDFVGDVNSDDDLDYKISIDGIDDSKITFCRRYADNNDRANAEWTCVHGGEPLLTDMVGDVDGRDDLDFKLTVDIGDTKFPSETSPSVVLKKINGYYYEDQKWNKVEVSIRGQVVEVTVNGAKMLTYDSPEPLDLNGGVGFLNFSQKDAKYRDLQVKVVQESGNVITSNCLLSGKVGHIDSEEAVVAVKAEDNRLTFWDPYTRGSIGHIEVVKKEEFVNPELVGPEVPMLESREIEGLFVKGFTGFYKGPNGHIYAVSRDRMDHDECAALIDGTHFHIADIEIGQEKMERDALRHVGMHVSYAHQDDYCVIETPVDLPLPFGMKFLAYTDQVDGNGSYSCSPLSCDEHMCQSATCPEGTAGSLFAADDTNDYDDRCIEQFCDAKKPYVPSCGTPYGCPIGDDVVTKEADSADIVEAPLAFTGYSSDWTVDNTALVYRYISSGGPSVLVSNEDVFVPSGSKMTLTAKVEVDGGLGNGFIGLVFGYRETAGDPVFHSAIWGQYDMNCTNVIGAERGLSLNRHEDVTEQVCQQDAAGFTVLQKIPGFYYDDGHLYDIEVVAEDGHIEVHVDGDTVLSYDSPVPIDLSGRVGLFGSAQAGVVFSNLHMSVEGAGTECYRVSCSEGTLEPGAGQCLSFGCDDKSVMEDDVCYMYSY
ncbi:hypothetical protein ACXWTF_13135 [Thiomicrolovo sp. ZZH C-3]